MTTALPNEEELILVNKNTGQEYNLDIMYDPKTGHWEKVFANNLANMLNMMGDEKTRVIAHLIKKKDYLNIVNATMREIADDVKVSTKTVNRVMKKLQQENFIHKVRNGRWRFSPHIIRHGKSSIGAAVIKLYDEVDTER